MDYIIILNQILGFLLTLYADPMLARKIVQDIVNYFETFLKKTFLPSLKMDILDILKDQNITPDILRRIDNCFDQHINIFRYIDTECKRFSLLSQRGLIAEKRFFIGRSYETKIFEDDMHLVPDCMFAVHIPLRKSLKIFLEIPRMFMEIFNYANSLSKDSKIITNILQADLWINKYSRLFANDFVLPLYISYDDLEAENALGSHAGKNKFGCIYVAIASLPPKIASRLSSIIFSTIFHTNHNKKTVNEKIFNKLIDELNFLQKEGIIINIGNKMIHVKFQLVLILGDNLGLNAILGFVESFSARYYCRICKAFSRVCNKMVVENEALLRNKHNYSLDVAVHKEKETGVKKECTFHRVNNFHIVENMAVNMMHDFLEGVCVFILKSILKHYIFEKKYFTLHELNSRIANFEFDSQNKPQDIQTFKGKNELHFKISASEMYQLMRFLGTIIGNLIPRSDQYWNLYKLGSKILDILMSPRVVRSDAITLKDTITKLHEAVIELYGVLKLKLHFMLHYPRILLLNGPIVKFWCMRFESFHQLIKRNANSSNNAKNLLTTIAKKQALKL